MEKIYLYCKECKKKTWHAVDGDMLEYENVRIMICQVCGNDRL